MGRLKVLILQAGGNEIVPIGQAETLKRICADGALDADLIVIKGALHTEIMAKYDERRAVAQFLNKRYELGRI